MLSFIDDFSRKTWVYFLKEKSQVPLFSNGRPLLRTKGERQFKGWGPGWELSNEEFNEFGKNEGIVPHRTVVGTPQQNGVAERMSITWEGSVYAL